MIEAVNLTKRYGDARGVEELNFRLEEPGVYGFLGPNGAGKSTTMRLLVGHLRPTSGDVLINGLPPTDARSRRSLSYLPSDPVFDESLTPVAQLEFLAALRGEALKNQLEVAEMLDLDVSRRIGELSRGNRQKVGLCHAFGCGADIILLDEPTSGLDPLVQQTFIEMTRTHADNGIMIFLSSHLLEEVDRTADTVTVIREGRIVFEGATDALREEAVHEVRLTFSGRVPRARLGKLGELTVAGSEATLVLRASIQELIDALAGSTVTAMEIGGPDLERAFLSFYSSNAESE